MNDYYSRPHYLNWLDTAPFRIRLRHWAENIYLRWKVETGSDVLDVGCGNGRHLRLLERRINHGLGIDLNAGMIAKAKELSSGCLEFMVGNAMDLEADDDSFDYAICMTNTFGNFGPDDADKIKALHEMKRVIRPEGRIILSVYSEHALQIRLEGYRKSGLDITRVTGTGQVYSKEGLFSEQFSKGQLQEFVDFVGGLEISFFQPLLLDIMYICNIRVK